MTDQMNILNSNVSEIERNSCPKEITLSCEECEYETKHKLRTQPIKKWSCEECDFETKHQNKIDKYRKTNHRAPAHPCNSCSYQAIHTKDLQRHQNTINGAPYTCKICDMEFANLDNIRTHMIEGHRPSRTFRSTRSKSGQQIQPGHQSKPGEQPGQQSKPGVQPRQQSKLREQNPKASSSSNPEYGNLECHGSCSSIRKVFQDKDEFELHMMFYHDGSKQ